MKTLGQKIRDKRSSLNITEEELSNKTKIPLKIISAIEQGTTENILGSVYMKSYIKKITDFLNISQDEYKEEIQQLLHPQKQQIVITRDSSNIKVNLSKNRLGFRFKLVLLGLFIVAGLGLTLLAVIPMVFQPGARDVILERPAVVAQTFRVRLNAKRDVWIQVKVDGRRIFSSILSRGNTVEWDAKDRVDLWSGRVESLSLYIDGRTFPLPGSGVVRNIVITREGAKRQ
jgi:transcriptional regulator with XRE-family HTH domain